MQRLSRRSPHPPSCRLPRLQEKIRPIDKKLQYQIEKLLKATAAVGAAAGKDAGGGEGGEAAAALAGGDDPLRYGPRPDALVAKQTGGTQSGKLAGLLGAPAGAAEGEGGHSRAAPLPAL